MTANVAAHSAPPGTRKRRERSPNYPGVGLQKALELARTLRKQEGRNPAPVNAVLGHWGYKPKSGGGLVAVAALKKFGLVTDAGSGERRTIQLSDLANRILVDERESSHERDELIKQAALMPAIHREIWTQYAGNLPSDPTLSYFLKTEKGFTDVAVKDFISQFRGTVAFAKLSVSDRLSEPREGQGAEGEEERTGMLNMEPPPDTGRVPPVKPPAGRAVLWQQTQPLGSGLMAEVRIIGEASRTVRLSDLERLRKYLDLGIETLQEESAVTSSGVSASSERESAS